ncbi:type I DNA topoisomerase [Actinomyces sp. zg-332]|uniref:type I DNA topoisomerase n=1 Tax=Actinomyces sp. zg-332 TaxID=2708340 RepID=UPI0014239286|nr:type I DNA topoisomerase [Actinomyces sp. zg-332]QPK94090.1 type I DNA topoisomerase [Actinomyces sp. zg-332]
MSETKLVIVESPAKARTISSYLGAEYRVEASIGHIRDLPQPSSLPDEMKKGPYGKFAVNIETFEPYYVVDSDKKKKVAELKKALKEAKELYLATDEDREGEAIAWHLLEVLKPKIPVYRMVFHEITKEAIAYALENTRQINENLVDAQETRRILDRLVGYEVSPLLWRKIKPGMSAGRVQSVATRLIVERERERMVFKPMNYSGIEISFENNNIGFKTKLVKVNEQKIATGRDFTDQGTLTSAAEKNNVLVLNQEQAEDLAEQLKNKPTKVEDIETKPYTRHPAAPFTTSTLQQEASRKLHMNSREAMRVAQSLYENGYITYMRTDSTALSEQAVKAARIQAKELYGSENVSKTPRVYTKKTKGAQEAHEAIRPAGEYFRTPQELEGVLEKQQYALYDLIWKRTIASQMVDVKGTTNTLVLSTDVADKQCISTVSGTVIHQKGFLNAYEEGKDAARYGSDNDLSELPALNINDVLEILDVNVLTHTTTPAPRYTEASLVKTLEEHGIGRPSTYASIISVIIDRGYVFKKAQALVPSWLAFSVVKLLEENLAEMVDYDFTAQMENDLDKIAQGEQIGTSWLKDFYYGDGSKHGLHTSVENLGDIDAREINTVKISSDIELRVGRFGPYIQEVNNEEKRASVPENIAPDELTEEKAKELFEMSAQDGKTLGVDPETNLEIIAKNGRFGAYVTEVLPEESKEKPRIASLFKSMTLDTITLEQAVNLLKLPREIGVRDSDKEVITAQNGRFGPYIKCGSDTRTLETEEQIFTLTLEEALTLLEQPKVSKRRTSVSVLKELGTDPASEKPVKIKDGRFGPYITDGTTNVTVPKTETIEGITPERAYELLADKRAKGTVKKKATRATKAKSTKTAKTAKTTKTAKTSKKTTAKK